MITIKASAHIVSPRAMDNTDRDNALSNIISAIGEHCIIKRSAVYPTINEHTSLINITFVCANINEAHMALATGLQATGLAYDSERVMPI
jgi:hypothetical protein